MSWPAPLIRVLPQDRAGGVEADHKRIPARAGGERLAGEGQANALEQPREIEAIRGIHRRANASVTSSNSSRLAVSSTSVPPPPPPRTHESVPVVVYCAAKTADGLQRTQDRDAWCVLVEGCRCAADQAGEIDPAVVEAAIEK